MNFYLTESVCTRALLRKSSFNIWNFVDTWVKLPRGEQNSEKKEQECFYLVVTVNAPQREEEKRFVSLIVVQYAVHILHMLSDTQDLHHRKRFQRFTSRRRQYYYVLVPCIPEAALLFQVEGGGGEQCGDGGGGRRGVQVGNG